MAFTSFPIPTVSLPLTSSVVNVNASYTPSVYESSVGGFTVSEQLSGTPPVLGNAYANVMAIDGDSVNMKGTNSLTGWYYNHNFGGTAATGDRATITSNLFINNTTGNVNVGASYSALTVSAHADVNDNGTPASPSGQIEALNILASLSSTATNWLVLQGCEIDISVGNQATGLANKVGLQITQLNDFIQGTSTDAAIVVTNGPGCVGWTNGLQFGGQEGLFPFSSNASIISVASTGTVKNGIDFSRVTFASGAPLLAPLQTQTGTSPGSTGSMCWDANFIYVCTATNTWKRATLATF